jgi:hypothetical protein
VPRHVARLVTRLVVDYSASCRLVVNYFASTARLSASARHAARHEDRRALVVDYFACTARLGASARRAAHLLSSTTSPMLRDRVPRHVVQLIAWLVASLVIDYFSYAARLGPSARRAARHAAHRRQLRLA